MPDDIFDFYYNAIWCPLAHIQPFSVRCVLVTACIATMCYVFFAHDLQIPSTYTENVVDMGEIIDEKGSNI